MSLTLVIQHKGDPEPLRLPFEDLQSVRVESDTPGAAVPHRAYRIEEVGSPEFIHGMLITSADPPACRLLSTDPRHLTSTIVGMQIEVS